MRELTKEVKSISRDIIMDKCNSKEPSHIVTIADFNNWVIDRYESFAGKEYVKAGLLSRGYEVCKRKEATHYSKLTVKGEDVSELNFWLRSIK